MSLNIRRLAALVALSMAGLQLLAGPSGAASEPVRAFSSQGGSSTFSGTCLSEGDYTYYGGSYDDTAHFSGSLTPLYPLFPFEYGTYEFCVDFPTDCFNSSGDGTGVIQVGSKKFTFDEVHLSNAFGTAVLSGRYQGYDGTYNGYPYYDWTWTANDERGSMSLPFNNGSLSSCYWSSGELLMYAEGASEPPTGPCAITANRVDRVDGTSGGVYYEADVHQTPTAVEVCVRATGSGFDYRESVRIPLEPDPGDPHQPVTVDPAATPGNDPGSPCYNIIHEGGTTSTRVYLRNGNDEQYSYVCFGVGGSHIRVTAG